MSIVFSINIVLFHISTLRYFSDKDEEDSNGRDRRDDRRDDRKSKDSSSKDKVSRARDFYSALIVCVVIDTPLLHYQSHKYVLLKAFWNEQTNVNQIALNPEL